MKLPAALLSLLIASALPANAVPHSEHLQIPGSNLGDQSAFMRVSKSFFCAFDVSHRGFLTKRQLGRTISNSALVQFPLGSASFDAVDTNGDGRISEREYLAYAAKVYQEEMSRRSEAEAQMQRLRGR